MDHGAIEIFNRLNDMTAKYPRSAVLTGYELGLSRYLKNGSDVWLNNPVVTREASGTSGMSAAMNGSISVSTNDGWICEFAKDGENCLLFRRPLPDCPRKPATAPTATTSTTFWTTRFSRSTTITTTSGWTSSSMQ